MFFFDGWAKSRQEKRKQLEFLWIRGLLGRRRNRQATQIWVCLVTEMALRPTNKKIRENQDLEKLEDHRQLKKNLRK